jgi:hypothetical protein
MKDVQVYRRSPHPPNENTSTSKHDFLFLGHFVTDPADPDHWRSMRIRIHHIVLNNNKIMTEVKKIKVVTG